MAPLRYNILNKLRVLLGSGVFPQDIPLCTCHGRLAEHLLISLNKVKSAAVVNSNILYMSQ